MSARLVLALVLCSLPYVALLEQRHINLPAQHLPFYLGAFPDAAQACLVDPDCPYRDEALQSVTHRRCWGYELDCEQSYRFSEPHCPGDHRGWVRSKRDQIGTFYTQADFGYVRQQLKEMRILCEPLFSQDSSLECTEHARFCRARNIMFNFTSLKDRADEPLRYKMDVLGEGDVGGYCKLHEERLKTELDHISPLQSWGPELRFFRRLDRRPIENSMCDVVVEKPTFLMKIDATVNMYHHFCDFFNLYLSLHVNATHWDAFTSDVHILIWENLVYYSSFGVTWQAFTDHPLWNLNTFRGKTVCFRNVVFPLLPRMIFGLYYNTPIIYGCERSGAFSGFARHVLHRLAIPTYNRGNDTRVRVALLSRDTKYRRILNEPELLRALETEPSYLVHRAVFNRNVPFKQQLEIVQNSDVLIGIHGAGLTHLLFLPDWAGVFELYNCEDRECYRDLARLRGLKYVTWENSSLLIRQDQEEDQPHAKFTNYAFDVSEFVRLVKKVVNYVKLHEKFRNFVGKSSTYVKVAHDEL